MYGSLGVDRILTLVDVVSSSRLAAQGQGTYWTQTTTVLYTPGHDNLAGWITSITAGPEAVTLTNQGDVKLGKEYAARGNVVTRQFFVRALTNSRSALSPFFYQGCVENLFAFIGLFLDLLALWMRGN